MVIPYGPKPVKGPDGRYHTPEQGTLRVTRNPANRHKRRAYVVDVDGHAAEPIREEESRDFTVAPGNHSLRIRVAWSRSGSQTEPFVVQAGEVVRYKCGAIEWSEDKDRAPSVELRHVAGDGPDAVPADPT